MEITIFRKNIQKLISKTMIDKEFRKLALEDSGKAYLIIAGSKLPESIKLKFIDNSQEVENQKNCYVIPNFLDETWLG